MSSLVDDKDMSDYNNTQRYAKPCLQHIYVYYKDMSILVDFKDMSNLVYYTDLSKLVCYIDKSELVHYKKHRGRHQHLHSLHPRLPTPPVCVCAL
eukprot:3471190-Rhodomonas_salina.1